MASTYTITAADGFVLEATQYLPERQEEKGRVILIASAMGVKQHYYQDFAHYLAANGFIVYTFDYRGIGRSMPKGAQLRGFSVQLHEWATKDAAAMVRHIEEAHPQAAIVWMGHSVGGQLLGWMPSCGAIQQAVLVASQCGYWGNWSGGAKAKMWTLWHLVIPPLTYLFGYFPSKKMRLFENLPKGVALEWAKWGRHRDYLFGYASQADSHYHRLTIPMLSFSFSDDHYAPELSVRKLAEGYSSAVMDLRHIQPAQIGHRQIGHFGFFRKAYQDSLWADTLKWLG